MVNFQLSSLCIAHQKPIRTTRCCTPLRRLDSDVRKPAVPHCSMPVFDILGLIAAILGKQ